MTDPRTLSESSYVRVVISQSGQTRVVETGRQGPAGRDGVDGRGGVYRHSQTTPSATWTINHNLGFVANVSIEDADGFDVVGAITHPTPNTTVIEFSEPITGTASLS